MRDKLNELERDLKKAESLPLLSRVALVPILIGDLLSLLKMIITSLEGAKSGN